MKDYLSVKPFRIPYYLIGVVLVGVSIYILYYREILVDPRYLIGGGALGVAIITMFYNAFTLRYRIKTQEENNRILISRQTFEVISKWTEPQMVAEYAKMKAFVRNEDLKDLWGDPTKMEEVLNYIENGEDANKESFILILNYFEMVSVMVKTKYVDEETLKMNFKSIFVLYYNKIEYFIKFLQKSNSQTYISYRKLVTKWVEEEDS